MLRGEFEKLLTMLKPEGGVDKGDLAKIKEQVFGPSVFWVTETRLTDDLIEGGWLVRAAPCPHVLGVSGGCCRRQELMPQPSARRPARACTGGLREHARGTSCRFAGLDPAVLI
jgi:hypothetical protein